MSAKRILGLVLVIVIVVGLAGLRALRLSERSSAPRLAPQPITVDVATVTRGVVASRQPLLGDVVASEDGVLSARLVSQVLAVKVREGDRVARGETLVELDARELDDAVESSQAAAGAAREGSAAAEVAYETQRRSTARDKVLADAQAVSRDEWERSQAAEAGAASRLQAARAQAVAAERMLASARTRRGYATIRAPFDGVVSARFVSPGDLAAPGKPLVSLVRPGGVSVRVKIPAETAMAPTATAGLAIPTGNGEALLPIARRFPAADASHLATLEVQAPDALRLMPGTTVSVSLVGEERTGLIVPDAALLESSGHAHVFVVNGSRIRVVAVDVVGRDDRHVAIDAPIAEGDRVVVGSPARLAMLTAETIVRVESR